MGLNISVAMCTFNGMRHLGSQLESIAKQTRHPDELVVCDDGSSDSSAESVRGFARSVPFPTRLLVNDATLGSTKNFETAISSCRGDIIALSDQDDVWLGHKLECIERSFSRSTKIVAAFSDGELIDDDSRSLGASLWQSFSFTRREQRQFAEGHALDVLVRHPVVTGATLAFRREYLDQLAPIPVRHIHDRWISFLLAARGQFEVIPEPLIRYRQHPSQQMGPGPLSLRGQAERAMNTTATFYLEEIERFRDLKEKLEKNYAFFPQAAYAQELIEKKISHLEHRAGLPRSCVQRIPRVLQEILNGGYKRYSAGWKSVVKDLAICGSLT
ncbi:MAG: glycosyltransferase family 2 protein [Acidobacteriia bacterium]|nr:glycosyltransferase family 2 protein [Terriglobia bacterium]